MLKFYKIFICSLLLTMSASVYAQNKPFIIVVDLSKSTPNDSFTFQTASDVDITYSWTASGGGSGSGSIPATPTAANYTISGLPASSVVEISLSSAIKAAVFFISGNPDNLKVTNVKQWGDATWATFTSAFRGCENLTNITATDIPNLSQVTNFSYMFYGCSKLNGPANIGDWDVSNVTNFAHMFRAKAGDNTDGVRMIFNQDIGKWNTANATSMSYMFYNCYEFNQDISNWDVSNVTNFSQMFSNARKFNQPVGKWDISKATNLQYMFTSAVLFNKPLGDWNIKPDIGNNLVQMLNNSGLNCNNYSGTLNGWAAKASIPTGTEAAKLSFAAGSRPYGTSAVDARNKLINEHFWNITGDAVNAGTCANTAPAAENDIFTEISTNGAIKLDVVTNDTDANSDLLWVSTTTQPSVGGTVKVVSGSLYFTPTPGYSGAVEFSYTVTDGKGGYGTANVTVPVNVPTLPVTLTAYSATATANGVALNWKTAAELNNNRYEVEKSTDGKAFVKLAVVLPSTSFAYTLLDKAPAQGTNYYSLYQYDNNGTKNYLGTKSVNYKFVATTQALVYPNPVTSLINVDLSAYQGAKITITVADITGKMLYSQTVSGVVGKHSLQYKPKQGTYIVRLSGNGLKQQAKIIVL